ncbi:MAG: DUF2062 domain-containing protein [Epsilonproteobacteria bacterium]|nr:MAG: DUF2062 domain-containing protein [Campylobacterota bacterium]
MIKENIKKLIESQKIKEFISKYKIPREYLSVNRAMVTKAFLIGLFIAFIPMPMQMLLVVAMMRFFKFNLALSIALCWISNPFTMFFIYYIEYYIGSLILNIEMVRVDMSLNWFNSNFGNIFIPLYVGAFVLGLVVSVAVSFLVNYLWIYFVNKNKKLHYKQR